MCNLYSMTKNVDACSRLPRSTIAPAIWRPCLASILQEHVRAKGMAELIPSIAIALANAAKLCGWNKGHPGSGEYPCHDVTEDRPVARYLFGMSKGTGAPIAFETTLDKVGGGGGEREGSNPIEVWSWATRVRTVQQLPRYRPKPGRGEYRHLEFVPGGKVCVGKLVSRAPTGAQPAGALMTNVRPSS
jgi:hypothetical protein